MRTSWLYGLIGVVALIAGVMAQYWLMQSGSTPIPAVNGPIPEPPLHDLDGKPHTLAEWQGRVVILNFWATWCPPCREEMPEFVRLQQELGEKGVQFVGVAIDDPNEVAAFLKDNPVNYPIWIGDEQAATWADRLGNQIAALPFSVIFDRNGKPIHAHTGIFRPEQVLEALKPLLDRALKP